MALGTMLGAIPASARQLRTLGKKGPFLKDDCQVSSTKAQ